MQAAYDAITKGDTGPQMGGNPYGGYQQQGYNRQSYGQQGYGQQNYGYTGFDGFDGFEGFDPFGFGFGFGGYQQAGPSASGTDTPEMQAARNFVANGRYAEARRVLDGMTGRNARWYYLFRWPIRGWAKAWMPCRTPAAPCSWTQQHRVPDAPAPDAEPRPDLPHPDHLRPARWAFALVLEHDFAEPAVQLLLRRLGLPWVPDVEVDDLNGFRYRVAAPSIRFVPWAALASCWPLPQQLLPVSAAGGGRRRCTLAIFSGKII